jgi:hypothetical protein
MLLPDEVALSVKYATVPKANEPIVTPSAKIAVISFFFDFFIAYILLFIFFA